VYKEKTIVGSMGGYGMYERAIEMMADPRFRGEAIITDRVPLGDVLDRGIRALLEEKDKQIKILVSPSGA
jgi:(R,R)-butanediol dehydrogenase/meso-butanediol dehydrogenase/diacetyl reductase